MFRFSLRKRFNTAVIALLALVAGGAQADDDWSRVLDEARGQTVYFYAWGGSDAVNRYLRWANAALAPRRQTPARESQ